MLMSKKVLRGRASNTQARQIIPTKLIGQKCCLEIVNTNVSNIYYHVVANHKATNETIDVRTMVYTAHRVLQSVGDL